MSITNLSNVLILHIFPMSQYGVSFGPCFSLFRPEKTTNLGTFHAMDILPILSLLWESDRKKHWFH